MKPLNEAQVALDAVPKRAAETSALPGANAAAARYALSSGSS